MAFEKKVPDWHNEGSEPGEDLKQSGFTSGYKPPAAFFNWFWHGISEAVKELQNKASDKEHSHSAMTGATQNKAGAEGFVPAPSAGKQKAFLRGDGTWAKAEGVFIAKYNETSFAEVSEAYAEGKPVFCEFDSAVTNLGFVIPEEIFGFSLITNEVQYALSLTPSGWSQQLDGGYTPKAHASPNEGFGIGTADNYGHVKLSKGYGISDDEDAFVDIDTGELIPFGTDLEELAKGKALSAIQGLEIIAHILNVQEEIDYLYEVDATLNQKIVKTQRALDEKFTYGTSDLTAGSSSLTTGNFYFVYE